LLNSKFTFLVLLTSFLTLLTSKDDPERYFTKNSSIQIGDCCLDERIRGLIEATLDKVEATEIVDSIKWVEQEIPIKSLKALAIGYVVGSSVTGATTMITIGEHRNTTKEDKLEIREIIKRRLPAFIEKIERELHR